MNGCRKSVLLPPLLQARRCACLCPENCSRCLIAVVLWVAWQVRRTTGVPCVTSLSPRKPTSSRTRSSTRARRISSVTTATSCSCGGRTSNNTCSSTPSKWPSSQQLGPRGAAQPASVTAGRAALVSWEGPLVFHTAEENQSANILSLS